MNSGMIRRIDDLGRIVIPKEIRKNLHIQDGEPLEINVMDRSIMLTPLFTASGSEHSIGSVFKGNGKGIKNRNSDLQFHCHSLLPECQSVSGLQPF